MKRILIGLVMLGIISGVVVLTGTGFIYTEGENKSTPEVKSPSLTPEQEKNINELISRLSDDELKTRESAQSELIKIGEPALTLLRKALKEVTDPEAKMRLKAIIPEIESGMVTNLMVQYWTAPDKKDVWFYFCKDNKDKSEPPISEGYCHLTTKEDKYNGEPILKIEDNCTIKNEYDIGEISITSFFRKDKPFSPLSFSFRVKSKKGKFCDKDSGEMNFKDGKLNITNGANKMEMPIPVNEFIIGNIALRYLSVIQHDVEKRLLDKPILWIFNDLKLITLRISPKGKEEILVSKDKVKTLKFEATGSIAELSIEYVSEKIHPINFWLNENRLLVKIATDGAEIVIKQVSNEEAEKGVSKLRNK